MKQRVKIGLLFMSLLASICFCSTAFAEESSTDLSLADEAFIVSDDGQVGVVEEVSSSQFVTQDDEHICMLQYDVIARAQDYSLSTNALDSSASARAYITIKYRVDNASILLTGVSGKWERLDSTVVVGSTGRLWYGCQAAGVTNQNVIRSVSNNFSLNTGFSTYVPKHSTSSVGANLSVPLTHGNSQWTVYVQVNACP